MTKTAKKKSRPSPSRSIVEDGALSVKATAKLTGLGISKLYALIGAGKLASIKIDGRRLIPRRAATDLLYDNLAK